MKYIISENRITQLIEKYILMKYPMVKRVFFTTSKVVSVSSPKDKGYKTLDRNMINIDFINGKMTHSSSYLGKQIRNDIDSMFGLNINTHGSNWGMVVKVVK